MQPQTQTKSRKAPRRFRYDSHFSGTIKSDRSDTRYHAFADPVTGDTGCTCPAGQAGIPCKHVRRLLERAINRVKHGLLAEDEGDRFDREQSDVDPMFRAAYMGGL